MAGEATNFKWRHRLRQRSLSRPWDGDGAATSLGKDQRTILLTSGLHCRTLRN